MTNRSALRCGLGLPVWLALSCAPVWLALWGCAAPGPDFDNTRLSELRPAAEDEPEPLDPAPKALITVRRVDFPLGADTEAAWRQTDAAALPGLTAGVWSVNGMRIGVLRPEDREAFTKAMPEVYTVSEQQIATGSLPATLVRSSRLTREVLVDLTVPPARVETQPVRGGHVQLLVRTARGPEDPAAGRVIEVIPHHHRPRETVLPRSPLETQLDGTVFDRLTLRAQLPAGTLLVIGLDPSQLPEEGAGDADAAGDAVEGEGAGDQAGTGAGGDTPADEGEAPVDPGLAEAELFVEARPDHLGEALLTGVRLRQPTQVMLFLSARPLRLGIDPPVREPGRASVRVQE